MRNIGVVTVSRADYGIYLPILRAIESHPSLKLSLIVGGSHLDERQGETVRQIVADGFEVVGYSNMDMGDDSPRGVSEAIGLGVRAFGQVYECVQPDVLLVLGDRFEMFAAVAGAMPFNIPIAHIHGGELTEGATDNQYRYAISAMSHLHFVSTEESRKRLLQTGEEVWRVVRTGAPALDNIKALDLTPAKEFEARYGVKLDDFPVLVTYHPETLGSLSPHGQIHELLEALGREIPSTTPILFSLPNADIGGSVIEYETRRFCEGRKNATVVDTFGTRDYFTLMTVASVMVGNSSSGVIEAPSFRLPVVNVGDRQKGRVRARNVIDVDCNWEAITLGLKEARADSFRKSLAGMENPYGDGQATERIVEVLSSTVLGSKLLKKRFIDLA